MVANVQDNEPQIHFGLDVAQVRTVLKMSNFEILMSWARNGIANFKIKLGSRNYETLLDAPDLFEIDDVEQRREYFRTIFMECLANTPEAERPNHTMPA